MGHFRSRVVAGSALILLAAGSAAAAYVSSSGAGAGHATTITSVAGVGIGGTATLTLKPEAVVPLTGYFTNSNRFAVQVHGVKVTVSSVGGAGCSTSDFQPVNASFPGGLVIPAADGDGDGYQTWNGGSVQWKNDPNKDQNKCFGRPVVLTLDVIR